MPQSSLSAAWLRRMYKKPVPTPCDGNCSDLAIYFFPFCAVESNVASKGFLPVIFTLFTCISSRVPISLSLFFPGEGIYYTMALSNMPFTGLYDERGTACPASLIHCSVEVSIHGLRNLVSLGFLFQNTSRNDFADAVFHCRLAEDSSVTFIDCSIEKCTDKLISGDPEERLEPRKCSNILHFGSFFQCNVGRVEAGKDAVIFIRLVLSLFFRSACSFIYLCCCSQQQPEAPSDVYTSYIYETVVEENAVHLSVPLPSSLKGGMVTRVHEMYPVENATIFSFNVESAMPGQILDVRSDSHSISTDIELNTATIEVNEPVVPVSTYDSCLLYTCFRIF